MAAAKVFFTCKQVLKRTPVGHQALIDDVYWDRLGAASFDKAMGGATRPVWSEILHIDYARELVLRTAKAAPPDSNLLIYWHHAICQEDVKLAAILYRTPMRVTRIESDSLIPEWFKPKRDIYDHLMAEDFI
jgi:hypothetical protein